MSFKANLTVFNGKKVEINGETTHNTGDIIGCGIDVTNGKIEFWQNGEYLGVAWDDILTPVSHLHFRFFLLFSPKEENSLPCSTLAGVLMEEISSVM